MKDIRKNIQFFSEFERNIILNIFFSFRNKYIIPKNTQSFI